MLTADDIELLKKTADRITTGNELMGSQWDSAEKETIILQVICGSAATLKEDGDASSRDTMDGFDNCNARDELVSAGYLKKGRFKKKQTLIVTRKLLDAVNTILDAQHKPKPKRKR